MPPVNATPAMRGSETSVGPIDAALAGQQDQRVLRHARLVQQVHDRGGGQRGGLGGLGDDAVAGGEGCRELAGEDGEREVPGADGDEHAARVQLQPVLLAGGAGERGWARPGGGGPRRRSSAGSRSPRASRRSSRRWCGRPRGSRDRGGGRRSRPGGRPHGRGSRRAPPRGRGSSPGSRPGRGRWRRSVVATSAKSTSPSTWRRSDGSRTAWRASLPPGTPGRAV